MPVIAVIPARFASTRLPGKPLLDRTGKPLIIHVVEQARRAKLISEVIVATDDRRIFEAVASRGFRAVMTREDHPNGTMRIAEVAAALPPSARIIVNVQGDEPLIDPAVIDAVVRRLETGDEPMATVASPFAAHDDPANPNIVKVVVDRRGRAMYFSRSLIPHHREAAKPPASAGGCLKHIGIYAYRRDFLPVYVSLPPTPCEEAEKLEQLRALEHGHAIAVVQAQVDHTGIDTPEQYEAFVRSCAGRA